MRKRRREFWDDPIPQVGIALGAWVLAIHAITFLFEHLGWLSR